MTTLDIHALPLNPIWNSGTSAATALEPIVRGLKPTIDTMMATNVIDPRDSFGFALATPDIDLREVWDDPTELIAMVVYWGVDGPKYAANAVRKIRAAAREGTDSEDLRRAADAGDYEFDHPVVSVNDDGTLEWGDFPFDGAAYTQVQGRLLLGAVSALPKEQDPVVARLITGILGLHMHESDQRLLAA